MTTHQCVGSDPCLVCFTEEAYRELASYRRQALLDDVTLAAIGLGSYGLVLALLWAL